MTTKIIPSNFVLWNMVDTLNQSNQYRVITKYIKPEFYNLSADVPKKIGVFLDIESTGLSYTDDKLIELGMVKFEYSADGRIFRILEEFNGYQDPGRNISPFITELTGISDDMVKGKNIEETAVSEYLEDVDLIIAHNAKFDRSFFETTFPTIKPKAWACSMFDVNWNQESIESFKLEYISYKYNFFYEGHRAIIDCLVGIHILSQELYNSKQLVLKQLLDNAMQPRFKLWAKNAAYVHKDLLRSRKYRWETHPAHGFKAWSIELPENQVEAEINYLKEEIYQYRMNIPVDIFDAYSRFALNIHIQQDNNKYADKIAWINQLQNAK
jgi:DNA polymerase-3 subunit epsilon